jgi:hypothetical protein
MNPNLNPCLICFDADGEMMEVPCSTCKTFVHGSCLVEWIIRRGTCPVCRTDIVVRPRADEEGGGGEDLVAAIPVAFAEVVSRASTVNQFIWLLLSTVVSACLPWFFYMIDLVGSLSGFVHMALASRARAGIVGMPQGIVTCLTLSVVIHTLASTRLLLCTHSLGPKVMIVLTLPLLILTSMPKTRLQVIEAMQGYEAATTMEAVIHILMTYALMFFMTVPAILNGKPGWKVGYLCQRIAFVSVLSVMMSLDDARHLLMICSLVSVMTGVQQLFHV